MPTVPIPSSSTWDLFPALAVLVLVILVLVALGLVILREYKAWVREQNKARSDEREKQREWQSEQDHKRDSSWQSFINGMQVRLEQESAEDRERLTELTREIKNLAETIASLRVDFNEHVLEDKARFNVLLTDDQVERVNHEKNANRKKS